MKHTTFYLCLLVAFLLLIRLLKFEGGTNVGVIASALVLICLGYQFGKK